MSISSSANSPRLHFTATSGQTAFTVSFEFFDNADLDVFVNGTQKTITTDYTVSGGDGSTGTVTFNSGLTLNDKVTITRRIDIERVTDFSAGQAINRAALNTQLDTLTAISADNKDRSERALRAPDDENAPTMTLPALDSRKGTVLGFNATSGNVEAGPTIADVQSLANITTDIGTLADIEDGTDATDAIQDVAAIASNVSTVAGVASDIPTLAGISSDITSVADNTSPLQVVSGNMTDVQTVSSSIVDINNVADIEDDITTVAGISSDVTSVANVSSNVSALGTADVIADMAALNTTDVLADMAALNDTSVLANMAQLGTASVVANMAELGTASVVADIQALADIEDGTTSTDAISTVAANISGVNSFGTRYRVGASNPASDNDEGDLFYNTTTNEMLVYNGGAWNALNANDAATLTIFSFTCSQDQTSFTGTDDNSATLDYNTANFIVTLNGVILPSEDFTATSSSTFTLNADAAADVDDILQIYSFSSFTISQPYLPNSNGDHTLTVKTFGIESSSTSTVPRYILDKNDDTPNTNDTIGVIDFKGRRQYAVLGDDERVYASVSAKIANVTNAQHDEHGTLILQAADGSSNKQISLDGLNNRLSFDSEQTLYWYRHKGTLNHCTLDWDTPSASRTVTMPDATGHLGWMALDRSTGTTNVSNVTFTLDDQFETHMFNIRVHPSVASHFGATFRDQSNSSISGSTNYDYDVTSDGVASGGTAAVNMQMTKDAVGAGNYHGYRAVLYVSGRDYNQSASESPPTIFGNFTMYTSGGTFKTGTFGAGFNLGNAATETIGGIRFSFGGSTSIVSHDISHYGMVNNR